MTPLKKRLDNISPNYTFAKKQKLLRLIIVYLVFKVRVFTVESIMNYENGTKLTINLLFRTNFGFLG